jgi:CRISPR-associated protein Cas2
MKYTVSFDISDNRTRYRTVKILLEYGYRVQESVFEGFFSNESITELREKLLKIIDPKTDSIRLYPLCKECEKKVEIIGIGKKIEETEYIII